MARAVELFRGGRPKTARGCTRQRPAPEARAHFCRTLLGLLVLAGCGDRTEISAPQIVAPQPAAAEEATQTQADEPEPPGEPPQVERPYDEQANANEDIRQAVARAGNDKRVLLMFGANWCSWCRRLEHVFQNHAAVSAKLQESFELVHINTGARGSGANADINERYGNPTQHGLPVLVVLDGDGELVMTQETGALEEGDRHDPARVLTFLDRASRAEVSVQ